MDGRKAYRFTVRWGEERDTDDAEGRVVATSELRPTRAAIEALLPRFTGAIVQVPPRFFGDQDRRRARLRPRPRGRGGRARGRGRSRSTGSSSSTCPDADHAVFEADAARAPMCARSPATSAARSAAFGHVEALRRLAVGPFGESDMISLELLEESVP